MDSTSEFENNQQADSVTGSDNAIRIDNVTSSGNVRWPDNVARMHNIEEFHVTSTDSVTAPSLTEWTVSTDEDGILKKPDSGTETGWKLTEIDSPFAGYDVSRFIRPVQWTYVASFLVTLPVSTRQNTLMLMTYT